MTIPQTLDTTLMLLLKKLMLRIILQYIKKQMMVGMTTMEDFMMVLSLELKQLILFHILAKKED